MGLCEVVITLKGCVTLNAGKTQPGLPSELQDRQGYTEKHCFKTTNKHKNGNNKALSKLFLLHTSTTIKKGEELEVLVSTFNPSTYHLSD